MIYKPKTDSVVDEIHKIRREIADRFDGNIRAISADANARMIASGCPVWKPASNNQPNQGGGAGGDFEG